MKIQLKIPYTWVRIYLSKIVLPYTLKMSRMIGKKPIHIYLSYIQAKTYLYTMLCMIRQDHIHKCFEDVLYGWARSYSCIL